MSERMKVICQECKAELRVAAEHVGKKLKCPKCQAVVSVPAADHESQRPELSSRHEVDAPMQFVVRYAPDVISQPMSGEKLAEALAEGKLLPQMLFSEVGRELWQPLTFVSPSPEGSSQTEIEIVKAQYTPPLVVIAIGVLICIAGTRSPIFLFIGPAVISCGLWFAAYLWVNAFFTNVLALLRRIAIRGEPE